MTARDAAPPPGRIALHGGGEFEPGDEPFLDALVAAALPSSAAQAHRADPESDGVLMIVVVPAAAARERPSASAKQGIVALKRAATRAGVLARVEAALVVDRDLAEDPALAALIGAADLIHFPGGHPDLIPPMLEGTQAWRSILAALARGAVLAGASAGAMALAEQTWTPAGFRPGLRLVPDLIVVPHFAIFESNLEAWATAIGELDAAQLGRLGLDERTGVISTDVAAGPWHVFGEGRAHWFPFRGERVVARHGETMELAGAKPPA
ncbi:MAG: Type 1 glutamine amidotransferase-like domain-containing protein [Chloroflexota bacterium]